MTLDGIGTKVSALSGWRRAVFAFAAGCVSATGFAPLEFFPALLAGFAILVLLIDGVSSPPLPFASQALQRAPPPSGASHDGGARLRAGFIVGWAFAFGQFLIGWHWIGYAFLVQPDAHLWQMPFALLFLTAGLALYAGVACGLAAYFWQDFSDWKRGPARYFVLAVLYAASEWVRGHALTGFPWNLPAYGWGASLGLMQSAALFGAYGLSFLTILFGATWAEIFSARRNWLIPAAMALLFVGLWADGAARLAATEPANVPGVRLRLVQPDIPQREKLDGRLEVRNWRRLLELSSAPAPIAPTHIIWPEAAMPFAVRGYALDEIALLIHRKQVLLTGAIRAEGPPGVVKAYNSLYIVDPDGLIGAIYDKFHLVPFGEYVPFESLFARIGVTKLTGGLEGFSSGDGPHTYEVPGAPPVGLLICYEIIFPGAVTGAKRPGWFVNVTDDSWFGPWAGPYQHLLAARMRAIEEGTPVARAANTGISAVIDPVGRIVASLGLDHMGVVDSPLPMALSSPTPYARFGNLIFLFLLIIGAATAWFARTKMTRP